MSEAPDLVFKALSDPTRRGLFESLCRDGDQTVAALTRRAGVSQPAVSRHLAVLHRAGLIEARPSGRQTHYAVTPGGLAPMRDWAAQMTSFWEARFGALDDLLKRMDQ